MAYDLSELLYLLSPEGQAAMITAIRQSRARAGTDLKQFVGSNFPMLFDAIRLAADGTAEEAYNWIVEESKSVAGIFGPMGVAIYRPDILRLHATLRAEIDRPRAALPRSAETRMK